MNRDFCKIDSGDWVGPLWNDSPELTPYAQAIADHYPVQVPLFLTVPITLNVAGGVIPLASQTVNPYLYDVLILGANAYLEQSGDFVNNFDSIYLNITPEQGKIPWAVPNKIGMFPLQSYAGFGGTGSIWPIVKMPEAYFWPKNTELRIDWSILRTTGETEFQIWLTLVGIQLINPTLGFTAPEKITMPNGQVIEVGSRLPWFATVPIGDYQSRNPADFTLGAGQQAAQYLPPQDCDIELHDAHTGVVNVTTTQLNDRGAQTSWMPQGVTYLAIAGNGAICQALPFPKPHLLKKGHRLQITFQNNNSALGYSGQPWTIRGVRRCGY